MKLICLRPLPSAGRELPQTLSQTYILTVILSTIVAAVGLWRDSVAVIIVAMVIALLLGPNVALALSTTLADRERKRTWRAIVIWLVLLGVLILLRSLAATG